MEEVQERDLISRSEVYKLFTKNGMASGMTTLHVAQIDQLPAVDVMKLPTVQRLEKELEQAKLSLAIARLGEIAKKSAPKKIRPAKKVKPLAKGHADGKVTVIHIVDEWAAAGPKPTPPREIIPDLKPGAHVVFKTEAEKMFYGNQAFRVLEVEGSHAVICNLTPESAIPRPPETVLFVETKKLAKLSRPETKIFE